MIVGLKWLHVKINNKLNKKNELTKTLYFRHVYVIP